VTRADWSGHRFITRKEGSPVRVRRRLRFVCPANAWFRGVSRTSISPQGALTGRLWKRFGNFGCVDRLPCARLGVGFVGRYSGGRPPVGRLLPALLPGPSAEPATAVKGRRPDPERSERVDSRPRGCKVSHVMLDTVRRRTPALGRSGSRSLPGDCRTGAVRRNAARLVRAPALCLSNRRTGRGLAAFSPTHRANARSARRSRASRTSWSRSAPAGRVR
jgi:hypothetical protein